MTDVTFLLVEDDEIDIEIIQRAFKKLRIANPLIVAQNGIVALDILRGQGGHEKLGQPYIILLDINMPRMSGLEFLDTIRADEALKRSIVFMLTSSDDEKDILRAYENNIAGYVVKSNADTTFEDALSMLDSYWRIVELPPR